MPLNWGLIHGHLDRLPTAATTWWWRHAIHTYIYIIRILRIRMNANRNTPRLLVDRWDRDKLRVLHAFARRRAWVCVRLICRKASTTNIHSCKILATRCCTKKWIEYRRFDKACRNPIPMPLPIVSPFQPRDFPRSAQLSFIRMVDNKRGEIPLSATVSVSRPNTKPKRQYDLVQSFCVFWPKPFDIADSPPIPLLLLLSRSPHYHSIYKFKVFKLNSIHPPLSHTRPKKERKKKQSAFICAASCLYYNILLRRKRKFKIQNKTLNLKPI